jgi:hypothetical protein
MQPYPMTDNSSNYYMDYDMKCLVRSSNLFTCNHVSPRLPIIHIPHDYFPPFLVSCFVAHKIYQWSSERNHISFCPFRLTISNSYHLGSDQA